jgi:NAD(P)-dependent dehydrogenase (short-subunit alcohol dehydrogenase family)
MACRDRARGKRAAQTLRQQTGNEAIHCVAVDLSSKAAIESLARAVEDPVHVLINNAATAFTPHMEKAGTARVVNVASYWAGGLELDDLEYKRRRYDNDGAYRQSKQADRMLSAAFAQRLKEADIRVNACHPGDVNSKLSNNLGFGGHETPAHAAQTPVWLAIGTETADLTGGYFEHQRQVTCPFSQDQTQVDALYERCARCG